MSIAEVTARIEQIQALFSPQTTSPAGAVQFADQLEKSSAVRNPEARWYESAQTGRGAVTGSDVVADAKKYLGVPYVWGGTDPKSGLDCSGLVQRVYSDLGYDLPRVSYEQAKAGRPVAGLENARPGDILAFNSPVSHVAIYLGDGKMIEAPRPGLSVRITDVYDTPTAIRRILPETATARAASGPDSFSVSLDRARLGLGQYFDPAQVTSLNADEVLR